MAEPTAAVSHSDPAQTSVEPSTAFSTLPNATPSHLPRWRGFNLLQKFNLSDNRPFNESDFKLIHQLGFNFVRLPMDYRTWIVDKDWTKFDELQLRQTRGYSPTKITHFKASWMPGSDQFSIPRWPEANAFGTLYSPGKSDLGENVKVPLSIEGDFSKPTVFRIKVAEVSKSADLVVSADGQSIWLKTFRCGPGDGEWESAHYEPQWRIYRNTFNRNYSMNIPTGANKLTLGLTDGDWLSISEIGLKSGDAPEQVLALNSDWGQAPSHLAYNSGSSHIGFERGHDKQWLWSTMIEPWKKLESTGVGVFVGEFGCFNQTPHHVTLSWMEDCLKNWQQAGWGWALWNFTGSFGVLDSDRADVKYEDFEGHKLDREMLELLKRY